jgi:1,4-dihydroxy-6-naphthoate synthase
MPVTLLDTNVSHFRKPAGSQNTLVVSYTPDSDDVFNFYAWERGHVRLPGQRAAFERHHINHLNRIAMSGEHDVTNISSAIYPAVADQYFILSSGASVGRDYGPVLVSKNYSKIDQLAGKRIAVGGLTTTGAALAMMFCPGAQLLERSYDQIAAAIMQDEYDAGVMIHEELLYYPQAGLGCVADLGAAWCKQTGLPLPVGLNVAHRRLGRKLAADISRTCRDSLTWAHDHFEEVFTFASQFGRGCSTDFVRMFCNADTLCMPADVRCALPLLFDRVAAMGLVPKLNDLEVIDA